MILALSGGAMVVTACKEEVATAPPPSQTNVCSQDACAGSQTLSQTCQTYLDTCIAIEPPELEDTCVAGAAAICAGI